MTNKSPSDFRTHADWLAYVRQSLPENEQAYALADGRTMLFLAFYRTRKQTIPAEFGVERQSSEKLTEPTRTAATERLNERILADLTQRMVDVAAVEAPCVEASIAPTPRQRIADLVEHLVQKNPSFALSRRQQGAPCADLNDAEFTSAMVDLDKVLSLYWDREQALPPLTYERAWFLHYLREPERMLQTRAVLHMLIAEITGCMSE